jgi:hypothetical protein
MSEHDTLGCHDFKMWGFTQITHQTGKQARILTNNCNYRICSLYTFLFQNLQRIHASAVWALCWPQYVLQHWPGFIKMPILEAIFIDSLCTIQRVYPETIFTILPIKLIAF